MRIIVCLIFLGIAVGFFVISWFQFKGKGYLFNNAYLWASPEERKRMDQDHGAKSPYYRQSGFAFLLIGVTCLLLAVYFATGWLWVFAVAGLSVVIMVIYAVASSVKLEMKR